MSCAPTAERTDHWYPLSFGSGVQGGRTFPSDDLTVPDPTTPTGLRLSLGPEGTNFGRLDEGLFVFGEALPRALASHDGWSVLGPILIPFDVEPNLESCRERILLINARTGQRHPLEQELFGDGDRFVLRARPVSPLAHGASYLLVILSGLRASDGRPFSRPVGFRLQLAAKGALARAGIAPGATLWSTKLTTHSIDDPSSGFVEHLRSSPPEVELVEEESSHHEARYRMVVRAPDREPVAAIVLLPAGAGPFPVVTYQHGFFSEKGSVEQFAPDLLSRGFAVVSADLPLHGERTKSGGPASFFDLAEPGQLAENIHSAIIDHLVLSAAIEIAGHTLPLDINRRAFFSVSLGSIVGAHVLRYAPEYGCAALATGGGLLSAIAQRLLERYSTAGIDAEAASALIQMLIDSADPASFSGVLDERQILLIQATEDRVIPSASTLALARALRLPAVNPLLPPPDDIAVLSEGASERGWIQFSGDHGLLEADRNGEAKWRAREQVFRFLESFASSGQAEIRADGLR